MILNICVDLAFLVSACSLGFLILYSLFYNRRFTQRSWTEIWSSGEGLQLVVVLPCFGSVCWLCEVFYLESIILVWPHVKYIFWLLCRQKYETQGEGTIGDCWLCFKLCQQAVGDFLREISEICVDSSKEEFFCRTCLLEYSDQKMKPSMKLLGGL